AGPRALRGRPRGAHGDPAQLYARDRLEAPRRPIRGLAERARARPPRVGDGPRPRRVRRPAGPLRPWTQPRPNRRPEGGPRPALPLRRGDGAPRLRDGPHTPHGTPVVARPRPRCRLRGVRGLPAPGARFPVAPDAAGPEVAKSRLLHPRNGRSVRRLPRPARGRLLRVPRGRVRLDRVDRRQAPGGHPERI
ncbi:MAG: hypothetical protein AVDCRST_MAG05-1084, partial [uncultured Rubrobacteraceae bacterium]